MMVYQPLSSLLSAMNLCPKALSDSLSIIGYRWSSKINTCKIGFYRIRQTVKHPFYWLFARQSATHYEGSCRYRPFACTLFYSEIQSSLRKCWCQATSLQYYQSSRRHQTGRYAYCYRSTRLRSEEHTSELQSRENLVC